jgi:hypothetical protein
MIVRDTLQDRNVPISREGSLSLDAVAIPIILSIAVIMYAPFLVISKGR